MISKAIFNNNNGVAEILCSKCGRIVKTQPEFSTIEKYALDGMVSLAPQYCDRHKYLDMFGNEKKREMARQGIKEKLREGIVKKNIIGVEITRPNQELIIMRGIPGSGKSTKANGLVGEGIIHSTDTLIEELTGDYVGYFTKMAESGDWSEHGKMHQRNFLKARRSMSEGISPVIIDNTNIKVSEPKKYIEAALNMGFNESNIKFVDVGDGRQTIEVLAERNTHGVPLKTIKRMLTSHKGVGPLSLKKVMEAKGGLKNDSDKVLYAAVVLDDKSRTELIQNFAPKLPDGWKYIAHHMTIVFGKGLDDKSEIGKEVELTVTKLGVSDMAMAVRVVGYPSANAIPHITLAINAKEGGKPVMSNNITNWGEVDLGHSLKLYGIVTEIRPNTVI